MHRLGLLAVTSASARQALGSCWAVSTAEAVEGWESVRIVRLDVALHLAA